MWVQDRDSGQNLHHCFVVIFLRVVALFSFFGGNMVGECILLNPLSEREGLVYPDVALRVNLRKPNNFHLSLLMLVLIFSLMQKLNRSYLLNL